MRKKLFSLIKKEGFFKKKVKLSSGKISDYYLDIRRISLNPQGLYLITSLFWKFMEEDIDAVGGPTLGADPIVAGLCLLAYKKKVNLKGFILRRSPKKYGQQNLIEGTLLKKGDKVVVVDDVATSGSSLIKTVSLLSQMKIKVTKALVVVDREEGASLALDKLNCPLISIFKGREFYK